MATVCEERGADLSNVHAFDLKSNEWAIAFIQIYESLLTQDYQWAVADLEDQLGKQTKTTLPVLPPFCMSQSVKPLIEFIHKYRLRVAPPPNTRAYRKVTNLKYTHYRLE